MALTANTPTTVGAAIVVLVFMGGAIWRVERGFSGLEQVQRENAERQEKDQIEDRAARERAELQAKYEFEKLDLRLKSIEGSTGDRWTRSDMRAYIREANAGGKAWPPID